MAVDMIVKSFLILFSLDCIVRYGSCAPIEGENLAYLVLLILVENDDYPYSSVTT